jgi:hypothetical protein
MPPLSFQRSPTLVQVTCQHLYCRHIDRNKRQSVIFSIKTKTKKRETLLKLAYLFYRYAGFLVPLQPNSQKKSVQLVEADICSNK